MAIAVGTRPIARAAVPRALGRGVALTYLSVVVLLPLAAVAAKGLGGGPGAVWSAATAPEAVAALELTLAVSLVVVAINAVVGTVIAWVLVRDDFRGKAIVNEIGRASCRERV